MYLSVGVSTIGIAYIAVNSFCLSLTPHASLQHPLLSVVVVLASFLVWVEPKVEFLLRLLAHFAANIPALGSIALPNYESRLLPSSDRGHTKQHMHPEERDRILNYSVTCILRMGKRVRGKIRASPAHSLRISLATPSSLMPASNAWPS